MKIYVVILSALFCINAYAGTPTELRCKNADDEELSWRFTVVSLPGGRSPGTIQGPIINLRLKEGETFTEYQDLFSKALSNKYWQEEGYTDITVSPSDRKGVDTLRVHLLGELWDAMGSTNPTDKGKIFIDRGAINLSYLDGKSLKRDFICALQLL